MSEVEKVCNNCKEKNLVGKSFNCNGCGTWNKFEEEKTVKREKKGKWLN